MLIAGIIVGLFFLVLAVKGLSNPFIGMIGLLCVTMMNPGELFPILGVLRMERIFVLIVFLSWFTHEKIVIPPISKKLLAFWAVMFLGVPFAYWKGGALEGALAFATTVLYHLIMINLVNNKDRFRTIITVYVALIGWIAGGAIWGYLNGQFNVGGMRHGLERAQGLTSSADDPNSLGVRLLTAMPLMFLLFFAGTKKQKLLSFAIIVISIFTIFLTGSRGSFVTMLLLMSVFFLTRRAGILFMPVLLGVFAVAWLFVPDNIKDRYLAISDVMEKTDLDESFLARKYCREAGWNMFVDHPITGVGAGVFKYANGGKYWPGPGRKHWLQAHNLYIQLLADMGIIGTLAWLVFFFSLIKITLSLKRLFKNRNDIEPIFRHYPTACFFCLAVPLINGYSTHTLYSGAWYFLAALSGALYYQIFYKDVQAQVPRLELTPSEPMPQNA